MLVPGNVWEGIIGTTDCGLEEDETESGFEDLKMVLIPVERLAELKDGGIAVSHNVGIDLLSWDSLSGLEVHGGNAETTVHEALVC